MGSEMCIRDRCDSSWGEEGGLSVSLRARAGFFGFWGYWSFGCIIISAFNQIIAALEIYIQLDERKR